MIFDYLSMHTIPFWLERYFKKDNDKKIVILFNFSNKIYPKFFYGAKMVKIFGRMSSMEQSTFQTWKQFIEGKKAELRKVLNTELYEWITNLEFVDVALEEYEFKEDVFYNFKISPIVNGINGFDIPKFREIKTLRTIDLVDFKKAWPGLTEVENQTLIELFKAYNFDALYERFLDKERQEQIDEWKSHMQGKKVVDILLGKSGDVEFKLEDENGKQSDLTIYIPYTIYKRRLPD